MVEPTAQGTQPDATPAGSQANDGDGVQKRINELTAQRYDEQRKREAAEAREQAYLTQIADLISRSQPQAPQAPAVEIDPALKQQFDAMLSPFQKRLEMTLAQIQRAQAITQVRTQAPAYIPDPVKNLAEKITEDYAKQGYNLDSEMAYDIALGRHRRQELISQSQAQGARTQFNGSGVPVLTGQSLGIPGPSQPQKPDLDKMSLQERMAYWDSQPDMPL